MAQGLSYGTYYSSQPTRTGPNIKRLIVIGVVIAVLLGAGLLMLNIISSNAKNDLNMLAARENSLLQLATTSQPSLRNPDISTANSNAAILLTSDVTTILNDTGAKKLDSNLVKQLADTNGERLKQAGLLDKFDTTYRGIVIDKVTELTTQARSLRNATSSEETQALLDKVLTNLDSIGKQFTALEL